MPDKFAKITGQSWVVRIQLGRDRDDLSKNALLSIRFHQAMSKEEVRRLLRTAMANTKSAGHAYTCRHVIQTLKFLCPDCQIQVTETDMTVTDEDQKGA